MADQPTGHAVLTNLGASGTIASHDLRRPICVLGRVEPCDIRISGVGAVDFHAAIIRCPDGWYVGDLGGLGDTRVNAAVCRWRRLRSGDELLLGRSRFRFDVAVEMPASPVFDSAALVSSNNGARLVAPEPMVLLGSAWYCDAVVREASVAPVAALLAMTAEGPVLRALGGATGVMLNGKPIVQAALRDADRVALGGQEWRFETVSRRGASAVVAPPLTFQPALPSAARTEPEPLLLSAGILDQVDIDDVPSVVPHYRAGVVRLDGLTHLDRIEPLVAARLPADLRPAPVLARSAEAAPVPPDSVRIDAQMQSDLARLERVQTEIAAAARQVSEPARSDDWSIRAAEYNLDRRQLRDEQQQQDAHRAELRRRAEELESAQGELRAAQHESQRLRQTLDEESQRLADRARVLAETQARVDRVAAALDEQRALAADHAARLENRLRVVQRQTTEAATQRLSRRLRRRQWRDAWKQRRREWTQAMRGTEARAGDVAAREADLRRRSESLDAEMQQQRDACEERERAAAARSDALHRREQRIAQREQRLSEREQLAAAEASRAEQARAAQEQRERDFAARIESLRLDEERLADRESRLEEARRALDDETARTAATRDDLERRERSLAESLAAVEGQLAQSEENAASLADKESELERRAQRLRSVESELARQTETLERAQDAMQQAQAEWKHRDTAVAARETAAADREARIDARRIQLEEALREAERQRDAQNGREAALSMREAAVSQQESREEQVAAEARRLAFREMQLRHDADAYEARVGELVRQREELDARDRTLQEQAETQRQRRLELEHTVNDRMAALEQELAARRRDVEAALEARRREVDAALEAARNELQERAAAVTRERAALAALRQQWEADRAAADLRSVIGELSPPRRRGDETPADPDSSPMPDIDARQAAIEARSDELERQAGQLEIDRARFAELQSEFDSQQRDWAEQRDQGAADLQRQRDELAASRRLAVAAPTAPLSLSAPPAARISPAPPSRRGAGWLVAATIAALALGFVWPASQRTVRGELQMDLAAGAAALREAERDLWQPDLLRAAAARAGASPDVFEKRWMSGLFDSQIDPAGRRIVLTAVASADDCAQTRGLMDALMAAYRERHQAVAASRPEEETAALLSQRDEWQQSFEKVDRAAAQAETALAQDQGESRRRTLQARQVDVKSQYDKARTEAEQASQAAARLESMTADDAPRLVDAGQIEAALAADAMYAADSEQVRGQSLALQAMLLEADKPVPDLIQHADTVAEAAIRATTDAGQSDAPPEAIATLATIGRQWADHKALISRFGADWSSRQSVVRAWNIGQSADILLQAQRGLTEKHEALARQGLARLDAIRTAIESLLNGSADTARRESLQGALSRALRPVQENYAELVQATSGVSGDYYPRIDAARRAVTDLSRRLKERRSVIEALLVQQVRDNWSAQHSARLTRAQHEARQAAARRDQLSEELGDIQDQLAGLLSRDAGLDARRAEARARRAEADRLKKQIADLDAQLSAASTDALPSNPLQAVIPAAELPLTAWARLWRALLAGGIVAIVGWLALPLLSALPALAAVPRTIRSGGSG